jgi:hypothetical protein
MFRSAKSMQRELKAVTLVVVLGLASVTSVVAAPVGALVRDVNRVETGVERVQWGGGYCERLRRACVYKAERGEVGEGNCRRYRAECSGRQSYCERLRRACVFKAERGEIGEGNCRRYRNECRGSW